MQLFGIQTDIDSWFNLLAEIINTPQTGFDPRVSCLLTLLSYASQALCQTHELSSVYPAIFAVYSHSSAWVAGRF